jgi:hypothetical protein
VETTSGDTPLITKAALTLAGNNRSPPTKDNRMMKITNLRIILGILIFPLQSLANK